VPKAPGDAVNVFKRIYAECSAVGAVETAGGPRNYWVVASTSVRLVGVATLHDIAVTVVELRLPGRAAGVSRHRASLDRMTEIIAP
jgi:hypothetical protein